MRLRLNRLKERTVCRSARSRNGTNRDTFRKDTPHPRGDDPVAYGHISHQWKILNLDSAALTPRGDPDDTASLDQHAYPAFRIGNELDSRGGRRNIHDPSHQSLTGDDRHVALDPPVRTHIDHDRSEPICRIFTDHPGDDCLCTCSAVQLEETAQP